MIEESYQIMLELHNDFKANGAKKSIIAQLFKSWKKMQKGNPIYSFRKYEMGLRDGILSIQTPKQFLEFDVIRTYKDGEGKINAMFSLLRKQTIYKVKKSA